MKKSIFKKLILFVLTMALLVGSVVCIAASASEVNKTYEIKYVNVSYGDRFNVLVAIDAPIAEAGDIEVTYKIGKKEYTATYWADYTNSASNTTGCPIFYTAGISAKDCGETLIIEAHKKGARVYTPEYKEASVASYLAKRLYKDGYIVATEEADVERRDLYTSCLDYIASAQEVLWNYVYVNNQRTLVTDRIFIGAKDGYVNDVRDTFGELRVEDAIVTVNYTGEGAKPDGWYAHYLDGSYEIFESSNVLVSESCYLEPYYKNDPYLITFEESTVGAGIWTEVDETAIAGYTHKKEDTTITVEQFNALSDEEKKNYIGKYTAANVYTHDTEGDQTAATVTTKVNEYVSVNTGKNSATTADGHIATPNCKAMIAKDALGRNYFHYYTNSYTTTVYGQGSNTARPLGSSITVTDDASVSKYNVTVFEFEAIFGGNHWEGTSFAFIHAQNGLYTACPNITGKSDGIRFYHTNNAGYCATVPRNAPVTVRYEYYHDTGILQVYIDGRYMGESDEAQPYTSNGQTVTYKGKIKSISVSSSSTTSADISFYSIKAINTYKEYDENPVNSDRPVYETFDSEKFALMYDEWACTNGTYLGEFAEGKPLYNYEIGTDEEGNPVYLTPGYTFKTENRQYGSYTTLKYSFGAGYSNVHGAELNYITDSLTGNNYYEIYSPARVSGSDRAYQITVTTQYLHDTATTENLIYVFDFDLKATYNRDGEVLNASPFNMIISGKDNPAQISFNTTNKNKIVFNGAELGNWDEWNSLRFEFYPLGDTARIKVLKRNTYGEYEYVYTWTETNSDSYVLKNLKDGVKSINMTTGSAACFNIDNVALYTDTRDSADWYDTSKEVTFVYDSSSFDGTLDKNATADLQKYIADYTGKGVYVDKTGADVKNSVIIGDAATAYTATAKEILDSALTENGHNLGYIIYQQNDRTAIYWNDFRISDKAIEDFKANYLKYGNVQFANEGQKIETFDLSAYLSEREDNIIADAWVAVEEKLKESDLTDAQITELVDALKALYAMTDYDAAVEWIAELYDPKTGGWHRSPSGRDNIGFEPNIESTYYGLNIFGSAGELVGTSMSAAVPEDILTKAAEWILGMQDDKGYFYHPQWPKEFIEANGLDLRITRDRSSARTIIQAAGLSDQLVSVSYMPSGNYLLGNLGTSTVVSVAKVVAVADSIGIAEAVESDKGFAQFIAQCTETLYEVDENGKIKLDEDGNKILNPETTDAERASLFYTWGSWCQSVVGKIGASKVRTSLAIEFFNSNQNPENGVWSENLYYNSANAIHKISSVYTSLRAEMQCTEKMIASNLTILGWVHNGDDDGKLPGNTCEIYNIWSNFNYIYSNIRTCGSGTTEEKEAQVSDIKNLVYEGAAAAIEASRLEAIEYGKDKTEKGFSSYSTQKKYSANSAYGCATGLTGIAEGDLDGFLFAAIDIPRYVFKALELDEIPYFTEEDRVVYEKTIRGVEPVDKIGLVTSEKVPIYGFENDNVGDEPTGLTITHSGESATPGSYIKVNEEDGNKVVEFNAVKKTENTERSYHAMLGANHTDNTPAKATMQFKMKVNTGYGLSVCNLGFSYNATPIQLSIKADASGNLTFHETDGTVMGTVGIIGDWFELKIVYDWGEGKYYVYTIVGETETHLGTGTSTLAKSSDGYVNHQPVHRVAIASDSGTTANYFMDDIKFYTEGAAN